MKKLIPLLILFVLLSQQKVLSQNWSPINQNEICNFLLDGNTLDKVVNVHIDSLSVQGSDSVYTLNREFYPNMSGFYSFHTIFIGKRIIKKADSTFVLADSLRNYILKPFQSLNNNWLFDSTSGTIATIIKDSLETVFTGIDSVKVILLSTGDTIKLSKSYGIIQFPNFQGNLYYRLIGLQNARLGVIIPDFLSVFDFTVGDRFEYRIYTNKGGFPPQSCYTQNSTMQVEILSKVYNGGNYIYSIHMRGVDTLAPLTSQTTYQRWDSVQFVTYDASNYTFLNLPNNTRKVISALGLKRVSLRNSSNASLKTEKGYDACTFVTSPIPAFLCYVNPSGHLTNYFSKNLGNVYSEYGWSINPNTYVCKIALRAAVTATDSFGVFTSDGVMLHNNTLDKKSLLNIYPNPCSGITSIFIPTPTYNSYVEIYNSYGNYIFRKSIYESTSVIDLSAYPKGLYLLKLIQENKVIATQRLGNN